MDNAVVRAGAEFEELIAADTAAGYAPLAERMMTGQLSEAQIEGFLAAARERETATMLATFAEALRRHAVPFSTGGRAPEELLDTCGTGGDHSGTFNVSTAAALIAAGAGIAVAKHGNRSMTSLCGSADVLQCLGVRVDAPVAAMEEALAEAGICFLFAQSFHPAMRHVAPVRRRLPFRTLFNMLGPLANPARARRQLLGTFSPRAAELMSAALVPLGSLEALVAHGTDGLDEFTTTAPTLAWRVAGGRRYPAAAQFTPGDFELPIAEPAALLGGDAERNAQIVRGLLSGDLGPAADICCLNAGAAIYLAGKAKSIPEGIAAARESIDSGAAAACLKKLCEITHRP